MTQLRHSRQQAKPVMQGYPTYSLNLWPLVESGPPWANWQGAISLKKTANDGFHTKAFLAKVGVGIPLSPIHLTLRPLKKPAFVVFCLMLAVSPCSAVFSV